MKNIAKSLVILATSSIALTSCIDESFPTSSATAEQLAGSPKATESLIWALPAFFNNTAGLASSYDYAFGYGTWMHARDQFIEDMPVCYSSYDWFAPWAENTGLGETGNRASSTWRWYYRAIQTTNKAVQAINPTTTSETLQGMLAVAHTFRAFYYLEMAQMYEYLPSDISDAAETADIVGLTVPIVTDTLTESQARNNPRVSHEVMAAFILSELDYAEENISKYKRTSKIMPDLSVVYGIKARFYLWEKDYANAKLYARKAINEGNNTPLTKAEWTDPTTGFNSLSTSSWMWGVKCIADDDVVQTGIVNWTGWMSNEATYGYAAAGPMIMVSSKLYDRIADTDFRKLSWKAPEGHPLSGKETFIDPEWARDNDNFPEYGSIKFRPGQGNGKEYTVGSACDYPIMRIEEMYLIEAEAAAQLDAAEGKALLENFMRTYRDKKYTCTNSDIIDECILQKRIELWGEGLLYFDYKRLGLPVDRSGANFNNDAAILTTKGRPAWMNIVIPKGEMDSNSALKGLNNPNPSGRY